MKNNSIRAKNLRMAQLALFSALIIVLQVLSTVLPMPYVKITLTLIPVVLGGVYFGKIAATYLGAVFGAVVTAFTVSGIDTGAHMMFEANPLLTVFICFAKGMLAGFVSALIFEILNENNNSVLAVRIAAATAPIVNTAFFCIFLYTFYPTILQAWAGGKNIWIYMITVLVGINFIVEFILNVIICPIIVQKSKLK